jgi:SAM-dependent methyltransferase
MRNRIPGLTAATGLLEHPFDRANGVRTSGLVAGRHLKSGHRHDRHATAYYGVAPSVFAGLVRRWRQSSPKVLTEHWTLVDVGAGMGRAVLLASAMSFRSVVGVELNPTLARIARRNAAIWRSKGHAVTPIRISCADAVEFRYPKGPCVVFLFNPFGATVMRRFLANLRRQYSGSPLGPDILYVNREQEEVLERTTGWRRVFRGRVERSGADAATDRRILESQPDGEYAAAPYEDCSIWRWAE